MVSLLCLGLRNLHGINDISLLKVTQVIHEIWHDVFICSLLFLLACTIVFEPFKIQLCFTVKYNRTEFVFLFGMYFMSTSIQMFSFFCCLVGCLRGGNLL